MKDKPFKNLLKEIRELKDLLSQLVLRRIRPTREKPEGFKTVLRKDTDINPTSKEGPEEVSTKSYELTLKEGNAEATYYCSWKDFHSKYNSKPSHFIADILNKRNKADGFPLDPEVVDSWCLIKGEGYSTDRLVVLIERHEDYFALVDYVSFLNQIEREGKICKFENLLDQNDYLN